MAELEANHKTSPIKGCLVLCFFITGILTYSMGGCLVVDFRESYNYVPNSYEDSYVKGEKGFLPSIGLDSHHGELILPFVKVYTSEFPYEVSTSLEDSSIRYSDRDIKEFYFTLVQLDFEDGVTRIYTPENHPRFNNPFFTQQTGWGKHEGMGIPMDKRENYSIKVKGYSVDTEGNRFEFSLKSKRQYDYRTFFNLLLFEWMSV